PKIAPPASLAASEEVAPRIIGNLAQPVLERRCGLPGVQVLESLYEDLLPQILHIRHIWRKPVCDPIYHCLMPCHQPVKSPQISGLGGRRQGSVVGVGQLLCWGHSDTNHKRRPGGPQSPETARHYLVTNTFPHLGRAFSHVCPAPHG